MEKQLLLSKREAALALGVSVRTIENLLAAKCLRSVQIGARRLIPVSGLETFARRGAPASKASNSNHEAVTA
jgi:excisionase family DNA binding protein